MFPTTPVDLSTSVMTRPDRRPAVHTVLLVGIFVTCLVTAVATGIIAFVVIELIRAVNDFKDSLGSDPFGP